MKWQWWMAAAVAMALTAVACGGGDDDAVQTPEPTSTPTVEPTATPGLSGVELGRSVAGRFGCAACHSVTGAALVGPSWLGLFGQEEMLTDGSTVVVDAKFLRESIVEPNKTIVAGFAANIMPADFGKKLSETQIDALIEYIASLQ